MAGPELIVGLGNPGEKYRKTRHNAGFWLVDDLASRAGAVFRAESKVEGESCRIAIGGSEVRLFKPSAFMNLSGQAVRRFLDFYRLEVSGILVVHDDLDLLPGTARLKQGGGHGGHNGLRDLIAHCGADFLRLRIGIGHPGDRNQVTDFVLKLPSAGELAAIETALDASRHAVEALYKDTLQKATQALHLATPGS